MDSPLYLRLVNSFKSFYLLLLLLFFAACSTTPPKKTKVYFPKSQSSYSDKKSYGNRYNDIDVNALVEELDLNYPLSRLGYEERGFNTCKIKSNKSTSPSCKNLYLTRLNFQVMCRDSTGTVEKVNLTPLHSRKLRWKKKGGKRGVTATNSRGFGSLGFISNYPAKNGYLYLYLGSKIARKRFLDNWKLILPKSWCDSQ